jgi:hypothetical protein
MELLWQKFYFAHMSTLKPNAHETARKNEKGCCKCVLKFNFAYIKSPDSSASPKMSKSLYPNV